MRKKLNGWLAMAAGAALAALSSVSHAEDRKTVAYLAPSLDISYWQWVGFGVKQKAQELGSGPINFV